MRALSLLVLILILPACANPGDPLFGRRETTGGMPMQSTAPAIPNTEYRLGTGDVISVRVYGGEEDLRLERIRLDSAGTIALPFGEFKARGATSRELEAAIADSVRGRILRNPRVWVSIDEYRPFFVDGQVSRPGAYPYQPGLNVRRAVTIAGGFRERAAFDKIFIIREQDASGQPVKVDLNSGVGPGDTITVLESFF
jgi:polysaccharide export outer membrane protein